MFSLALLELLDLREVGLPPAPSGGVRLPGFRLVPQGEEEENDLWCWAASGAMVHNHYGGDAVGADAWAAAVLGKPCEKDPGACNQAHDVGVALRGYYRADEKRALTLAEVRVELEAPSRGRPIVALQRDRGHAVVVFGCGPPTPAFPRGWVAVADPEGSGFVQDYDVEELRGVVGGGWGWTFFTREGGP